MKCVRTRKELCSVFSWKFHGVKIDARAVGFMCSQLSAESVRLAVHRRLTLASSSRLLRQLGPK